VAVTAALVFAQSSPAQVPTEDSATGSGSAVALSGYPTFEFSATSDPLGGSPGGTGTWSQSVRGQTILQVQGTVSCLAVSGNQAVIGIDLHIPPGASFFQGFFLTVVDGGPAGSGLDSFDATPTSLTSVGNIVPIDCSVPFSRFGPRPVTSGDIVVVDAPPTPTSKAQCKNGGWRTYRVFKNQGDCVSFVATKGGNAPANGP
jgi:hypothetical protein